MADNTPQRVTVTDVDISFAQMVTLIFKFALACIPAALLLGTLSLLITFVLAAMGLALK